MSVLVRFMPAAAAAIVLLTSLAMTSSLVPLPPAARTTALVCIAASAIAAAFVRRPALQTRISVGLAIAGATAAGQAKVGAPFAVACAVLVLACVVALRAPRAPRGRPAGATRRTPAVVMAAIAAFVFGGLAAALPPLSVSVERYFMNSLAQRRHAMGFASTLELGSMHGLLDSSRPVLEVEGEPVEYLRGAVLDDLRGTTWSTSTLLRTTRPVDAVLPRPNGTTHIAVVPGARLPRHERARFFVPNDACAFGTPSGRMALDGAGVAFPDGSGDESIWVRTRGCGRAESLEPQRHDLVVPWSSRRSLEAIAAAWTRGATTDREKIAALERELSSFRYSVDVEPATGDPIVDFLTRTRTGYCEHFATSMALLARVSGVPARVVVGYRAPPPSSITGRIVVRERHAHAWVEAWVEGAWRTYDPTPPSEAMGRSSMLEDLGELVGYGLERAWAAVDDISPAKATALLVVLAGAFFLVRRVRRARLRGRGASTEALPSFLALASALERSGAARAESEPLERFARRLRERDEPWAKDAAEALARYAALRYGGVGDEAEVTAALYAATKSIPTS